MCNCSNACGRWVLRPSRGYFVQVLDGARNLGAMVIRCSDMNHPFFFLPVLYHNLQNKPTTVFATFSFWFDETCGYRQGKMQNPDPPTPSREVIGLALCLHHVPRFLTEPGHVYSVCCWFDIWCSRILWSLKINVNEFLNQKKTRKGGSCSSKGLFHVYFLFALKWGHQHGRHFPLASFWFWIFVWIMQGLEIRFDLQEAVCTWSLRSFELQGMTVPGPWGAWGCRRPRWPRGPARRAVPSPRGSASPRT